MAWLKCELGGSVEEKTLAVTRANFPNLSQSLSGCWAIESRDGYIHGHSTNGEWWTGSINLGAFDVSGYSSLIVNVATTTWGVSSPGAYIYLNSNLVTTIGNGAARDVTIPLNGITSVSNLYIYQRDYDGGGDGWWINIYFNSVKFIP